MAETTNTWSRSYTLGLQGPSKKVFGVGLEGPNTFWGGTWWSPRVYITLWHAKEGSLVESKLPIERDTPPNCKTNQLVGTAKTAIFSGVFHGRCTHQKPCIFHARMLQTEEGLGFRVEC